MCSCHGVSVCSFHKLCVVSVSVSVPCVLPSMCVWFVCDICCHHCVCVVCISPSRGLHLLVGMAVAIDNDVTFMLNGLVLLFVCTNGAGVLDNDVTQKLALLLSHDFHM